MYRTFFLVGVIGLFLMSPVFAQFTDTSLGSDISINVTPSNPDPLQNVTLEVKSYSVDLDQTMIVWRYNGKIVSSGTGKTRIDVVAPDANNAGLITVTVSGTGFASSTTAIDIRTAKVDLLWEAADSYTPPFYKGKALLSPNGLIRVTAIQSHSSPKNLSFEWTRNDSVVSAASGYNKNSIVFRNETLKQREDISVVVQSGFFGGTNNISLVPTKPQLVMYQKQDGFTDYNNGYLSELRTGEPGIVLRFEPYFFSTPQDMSTNLEFDIKNNDNQLYGNQKPNEVSLSRPDNGGRSDIEVSINTAVYSLQNILKRFSIIFN